MVTNNWEQYSKDAIRELRQVVYAGGHQLVMEYTEWPHFSMEYWLIGFFIKEGGAWIAVGHWNIHPAWEEFKGLGLLKSEPVLRNWERPLDTFEGEELAWHILTLRDAWPFQEFSGITLDGVEKALLLQEDDELPVIQHDWNMKSPDAAVCGLDDWLEVMRLRRYSRRRR